MTKMFLLFLWLLSTCYVVACTCASAPPLTKQAAAKLKSAYKGVIVAKYEDTSGYMTHYQLLVSKTYKGVRKDTIEFLSGDAGICGISTSIGDEWLVTWGEENDEQHLSICSLAYNLTELKRDNKYFRFKYRNGLHRMMHRICRKMKRDKRMLNWLAKE